MLKHMTWRPPSALKCDTHTQAYVFSRLWLSTLNPNIDLVYINMIQDKVQLSSYVFPITVVQNFLQKKQFTSWKELFLRWLHQNRSIRETLILLLAFKDQVPQNLQTIIRPGVLNRRLRGWCKITTSSPLLDLLKLLKRTCDWWDKPIMFIYSKQHLCL